MHGFSFLSRLHITLGGRDFSSAVSGFCEVFIVNRTKSGLKTQEFFSWKQKRFFSRLRRSWLRPKMCRPSANTENSRRMREKPLAVPSHFHIQFNQNCLKWGMKGEQGWCSGENTRLPPIWPFQGPVVRTPISANPQLNFNPGFFFFLPKVLSRKMFSIILLMFSDSNLSPNFRQRD